MKFNNLTKLNYLGCCNNDYYYELPLGGQFARYFRINNNEISEVPVFTILQLKNKFETTDPECWCCGNRNVTVGKTCKNCGEVVHDKLK